MKKMIIVIENASISLALFVFWNKDTHRARRAVHPPA